ncbi:hypothetical protein KY309_01755 [Candidatus Woesearchaeota archaeon]|nr:hypothetical protein [Candidatus Woesearchaeota archaeon]MBW3016314.1 hypothetical protein [Candidatus Woesearchaeota archaeon]
MKKILIAGIAVLLLSLTVFAIVPETSYKTPLDFPRRSGIERVTNYDPRVNYGRIETVTYLSPLNVEVYKGVGRGGYAPMYPRATARIKSTTWYGYPSAQVMIDTKDLPRTEDINGQFEVWLVDVDANYRLSLGTFTTNMGGIGQLGYKVNNFLDAYDYVEITAEPLVDLDVSPGPVALIGKIQNKVPPPEYYNPPPKDTKMITDVVTIN